MTASEIACRAAVLIGVLVGSARAEPGEQRQQRYSVVPQVYMPMPVVISPDGRWAVAMSGHHMRIWDCKGKCLRMSLALPRQQYRPVFRPTDGALLCNCGKYSLLIEPATGRVRTVSLPYGLSAFSSDAKHLAVATDAAGRRFDENKAICLLDARTFRELKRWSTQAVTAGRLSFIRNDTVVKLAGEGGRPHAKRYAGYPVEVTVELKTGKLTTTRPQPGGPGGRRPALRHRPPRRRTVPKFTADVSADINKHNTGLRRPNGGWMWVSPGRDLLVTSLSGALAVWDLKTGRRIRYWLPSWPIHFLGWRSDGRMTFSKSEGLVRWDPRTGAAAVKKMPTIRRGGTQPEMAPDGAHFLCISQKKTQMLAWSSDKPLWQRDAEAPAWHPIRWHKFPGRDGKLCFFEGVGQEVRLVEAASGKVHLATRVTRDDAEKVVAMDVYTMSGTGYLLLAIGDARRGRVERYVFHRDRIRHQAQLADGIGPLPLSVAFAGTGRIYAGNHHGLVWCLNPVRKIPPINIAQVNPYFDPWRLAFDPSGRLLCVTDEQSGGVALDAMTLQAPTEAACVAWNGHRWRGLNPVPVNGRIAAFGRAETGLVDLVDIRPGRTVLSLQSWGKDGWAAFTPDGKWIADDGGASRLVVYEGADRLSSKGAAELRQPKGVQALLAQIATHAGGPKRGRDSLGDKHHPK